MGSADLADVSIGKKALTESELKRLTDSLSFQRGLILNLMASEMGFLASIDFVRIAQALEPKIVRDRAGEDRLQWWQYIIWDKDDPDAPWPVGVALRLLRRYFRRYFRPPQMADKVDVGGGPKSS